MSGRLKRVAARGAKRLLSILVVVSLLVGSAGVPVVSRVGKDRSQPFPCQDNPCGCGSADECWHHCCCHTNREKVAWAHEHGVTPPDFVVAAAEKEEHATEQTCCTHHGCEKCAAKAAAHHDEASHTEQAATKSGLKIRLVLVDFARHCRNLPQFWSVLSAALPVRLQTAWSFDEQVVGRVIDAPVLKRCVELFSSGSATQARLGRLKADGSAGAQAHASQSEWSPALSPNCSRPAVSRSTFVKREVS